MLKLLIWRRVRRRFVPSFHRSILRTESNLKRMSDPEASTLKKPVPTQTAAGAFPVDPGASQASPLEQTHEGVSRLGRLSGGGRFRGLLVHSILGEGAMGSAYLVSHPVLQMPLVIKTFKASVDANIFREAHLAARVASPNVVGVLDAGYEAGVPFVTQRYIDGIDLDELVTQVQQAKWHLPVNMICQMLIDAAMGLHAIHQAGIVHRDVKPANLFLRGNGTSTVGDFGIAFDTIKENHFGRMAGTP